MRPFASDPHIYPHIYPHTFQWIGANATDVGGQISCSFNDAREKARESKHLRAGIDPLEAKRLAREIPTFKAAARAYHNEWKRQRRNVKHEAQWLSTLETYAFPRFGDLRIDQVGTGHVRDALAEIWLTKPETARRGAPADWQGAGLRTWGRVATGLCDEWRERLSARAAAQDGPL